MQPYVLWVERSRHLSGLQAALNRDVKDSNPALSIVFLAVIVAVETRMMAGTSRRISLDGLIDGFYKLFVLYFILHPLVVAYHETAHALVAASLGNRPRIVVLFKGKQLLRFRFFGIVVIISWQILAGGLTIHEITNGSRWRMRRVAIVAAGPLANIAVAGAALLFLGTASGAFSWLLAGLACSSLVSGLVSILPSTHKSVFGTPVDSDGRAIFKLLRAEPPDDAKVADFNALIDLRSRAYAENRTWIPEFVNRFPQDALAISIRYQEMSNAGSLIEARKIVADRLELDIPLAPARRAQFHNIVAWTNLLLEDADLLGDAEEHCERALALDPQLLYFDTKGWILLVEGDAHLAHQWFSRAYDSPDPHSRSSSATGLSYAAATLGDAELAEAWRRIADQYAGNVALQLPNFRATPLASGGHVRTQLDRDAIAGHLGVRSGLSVL